MSPTIPVFEQLLLPSHSIFDADKLFFLFDLKKGTDSQRKSRSKKKKKDKKGEKRKREF